MSERSRKDGDWTGWIIPGGALIIAAVLLLWTIWPRGSDSPSLSPTPIPSPVASKSDPHIVVTASGTFTFGYESGAVVIRRIDGPVKDLASVAVPTDMKPTASGDFTKINASGNGLYGLACPTDANRTDVYMLFGFTTSPPVSYSGPPAIGGSAPDGMWLFVLDAGSLDPNARVTISSPGPASNLPGPSVFMPVRLLLEASSSGVQQTSGCWLVGA